MSFDNGLHYYEISFITKFIFSVIDIDIPAFLLLKLIQLFSFLLLKKIDKFLLAVLGLKLSCVALQHPQEFLSIM